MAKLLNLDEFQTPERVLKLKGKEHVMKEMSVGDFIKNAETIAELDKNEGNVAKTFALMVDMVSRAFPTCPREDLLELPMSQLDRIIAFAREPMEAADTDPKQETAAAK